MSKLKSGRFALILLILAASLPLSARCGEPAPDVQEKDLVRTLTEPLFKQIEDAKLDQVWDAVNRLVKLGRTEGAVVIQLQAQLNSNDPKMQLACARALCQLNATESATPLLAKLVQTPNQPEIRKLAANAIGLTTSLYRDEKIVNALAAALPKETDDFARISISRSLWRVANDGPHASAAKEALQRLLSQAGSKEAKDEAALVLAENGFLSLSEVRVRLLSLYAEPTAQGERAFNLLRRADDENSRRVDPEVARNEKLLREILTNIRTAYPDATKYELDKLFEEAAKGLVASLDPFSSYLDRAEVKSMQEMLQQDYVGIGAYVGVRRNQFIVQSPIFGSPADRAGLRALDWIQEVDGEKTGSLVDKGGVNSVINKLKGEAGTPVRVKYLRPGLSKPVEVSIVREKISVDTVFSEMLPGEIGYIQLRRFSEHSADEMQRALDSLVKGQRAKAIVFDLRNNPGGLLKAGVEITEKFLDRGKLIVYSEGNPEFAPRRDYFSSGAPENEAIPMVALVNAGAASAAEIVAGALQDHKRATLIGEKTYGKGSVQQIIPLRATNAETQLRLTIAKYYLPTGRCIHEKGIDPDIEVKPSELPGWVVENLIEMRPKIEERIRETWDANKAVYAKLALNDEGKFENWPEFEAFYQMLKTRVGKDEIRAELRRAARIRLSSEQKRELVVDVEEDEILQRGILKVLEKLKAEPGKFAEYKDLPERFKKKAPTQLATDPQ